MDKFSIYTCWRTEETQNFKHRCFLIPKSPNFLFDLQTNAVLLLTFNCIVICVSALLMVWGKGVTPLFFQFKTDREAVDTTESTAFGTERSEVHRLAASRGGQKVWIWTVYCGQRHDVGFPRVSAGQTKHIAGKDSRKLMEQRDLLYFVVSDDQPHGM